MSYSQFDHIKTPFGQLDDVTQDRLITHLAACNTLEDIVTMYLQLLPIQDLKELYEGVIERGTPPHELKSNV